MMTQGVTARRTQHDGITASHASRWYRSGHGIASRYRRRHGRSSGHHTAAVVMMMVQMFGLTTATTAMHVAIGRHCEVHFFHGRPFGFRRFTDAIAICEFYVVKQGLEPF